MNIKVSIIVPVYNVEKYIERCLKSLINQTLKEIEIILVDDKSLDKCSNICDKYANIDGRIKVIHKEKNEGLGYARNSGIKIAKGEYIGFVDSDDYIDINYYEKMYNQAKKYFADVCYANDKRVLKNKNDSRNNEKIIFNSEALNTNKILKNILDIDNDKHCIGMSVWRAIFRAQIIKDNNILFVSEREFVSEDIVFDFDFLKKSKIATFVNDTYYYYCYNENSLTSVYRVDRFEKVKKLYEILIKKVLEFENYEIIKNGVKKFFIMNTRACIKYEVYNEKKEALKNIKKICEDDLVQEILKQKIIGKNIRQKIFNYLIKHKRIKSIYFLIKNVNN